MRLLFALAAGATGAALLAGSAIAGDVVRPHRHRHAPLPPFSGTIQMDETGFGRGLDRAEAERPMRAHRAWWQGDGTGLVGLVGGASGTPRGRPAGAGTVHVVYGEPYGWSSPYPVPPTGGLGHYSSGAPSTMGYYSSSSSAGPYGTTGGLGIYSSGSYGGPRIIHIGSRGAWRTGCTCGPQIIHVGEARRQRDVW